MGVADRSVLGFADGSGLAHRVAKALRCRCGTATVSTYPSGELKVIIPAFRNRHVVIVTDVSEQPESLLRVLALAQGARDRGARRITLVSPWIAYGRQDRIAPRGETALGLVIGRAVSSAVDRVFTLDAHSDAFIRSFGGALTNVLSDVTANPGRFDLVAAPDRGAARRAAHAATALKLPLVIVQKVRSGRSVSANIPSSERKKIRSGMRALLVDDIGDSGGTLIAAANALRAAGASSVHAIVTHAINLSVLREATENQLASVRAVYDHAAGRLSTDVLAGLTQKLKTRHF